MWLALLWIVTGIGDAWAHGGVTRTVHVVGNAMRVEAPLDEVCGVLGIAPGDTARHEAAVAAWMAEGLELTTPGGPCARGPATLEAEAERATALATWSCPAGIRTLHDRTLSLATPGEQTLVVQAGAGEAIVLGAARPSTVLARQGSVAVAGTFLLQGAVHLVTGVDHVLFLLCLLFVAGPTARREGRSRALRQLATIVTAFTVGHSVTLIAGVLDVVDVSGRLVEATIAGSIVLVALHNALRPEGPGAHRPWIAGGFGLVHGLGFSSVLGELGLPAADRVLALVSFNVGIELAQLAVVVVAIAPLAWLARHPRMYRLAVMQATSALIAVVASGWVVERLL